MIRVAIRCIEGTTNTSINGKCMKLHILHVAFTLFEFQVLFCELTKNTRYYTNVKYIKSKR